MSLDDIENMFGATFERARRRAQAAEIQPYSPPEAIPAEAKARHGPMYLWEGVGSVQSLLESNLARYFPGPGFSKEERSWRTVMGPFKDKSRLGATSGSFAPGKDGLETAGVLELEGKKPSDAQQE
uniref:Uncharacterized protein n=2 Tax=Hemiselmis andersenii TaxID=464988 RepID=A0A6U2C3M7_HEMAN|mmetsp:Transcript_21074/g.48350  ORF Transcript_21074/g.48350 Transcript_21074/m.48350 type:complete len:126 (+) Transcript_21074:83-460(+)